MVGRVAVIHTESKHMPSTNTKQFPAWGVMPLHHVRNLQGAGTPGRFRVSGRAGTPAEWDAYIEREVDLMASFLWPRYNPASGSWVGAAAQHMLALTEADMNLMDGLRRQLGVVALADGEWLGKTHLELFETEDSSARPTLATYLPHLAPGDRAAFEGAVEDWFGIVAHAYLRFKAHFQRPRPYQAALLLNRPFEYRQANTAVTPAMISGHAFQGLVVRCGAYMDTRNRLGGHPGRIARLQQYGVDIGDRRVFAGVHYPTDNLSSWFCGLRLCDHLFGPDGQEAKHYMWTAISTRSMVYRSLVDAVTRDPASPLAEPMRRLQAEAARPADVTAGI